MIVKKDKETITNLLRHYGVEQSRGTAVAVLDEQLRVLRFIGPDERMDLSFRQIVRGAVSSGAAGLLVLKLGCEMRTVVPDEIAELFDEVDETGVDIIDVLAVGAGGIESLTTGSVLK